MTMTPVATGLKPAWAHSVGVDPEAPLWPFDRAIRGDEASAFRRLWDRAGGRASEQCASVSRLALLALEDETHRATESPRHRSGPPRPTYDRHGPKISTGTAQWRHHSQGRGRQGWNLKGENPEKFSPGKWHKRLLNDIAASNQRIEDDLKAAIHGRTGRRTPRGLDLGDGDEIRERRNKVLVLARRGIKTAPQPRTQKQ